MTVPVVSLNSMVELALLSVEFVLLVATLIVLLMSKRELRGRNELLRLLGMAISVLTRNEYFTAVKDALMNSKKEVLAVITGSPPRDEAEEEILDEIVEKAREAARRGVKLRYLIPKSAGHLYVGYLLSRAGAEVKYRAGIAVYDLRYMVVDGRHIVIGQPRSQGEEEPTKKGYVINSPTLASLLKSHFKGHWNSEDSEPYESYATKEIASIVNANPGIKLEIIAGQLKISVEEASRLLKIWRESSEKA